MSPDATSSAAERPDPYAAIHGALRRCMADTLARLEALHAADATERGAAIAQVQELLVLLKRHALVENLFVHPAIEAALPGATRCTQDEHEQQLLAIGELLADCRAIGVREQVGAVERLHRQLARLVGDSLAHMRDEEERLAPLLLAGTSAAELRAIEQRALATLPSTEREALMRWVGGDREPLNRQHESSKIIQGEEPCR